MRVVLSVRFIGVERLAGAALAGKVFAHAAEQPLALRAGEVHRAGGEGVSIEAAAAVGDVETVAQHVRAGRVAACARAGKALLAKTRCEQRDEVAGAVGVRLGRGGGEKRRADERGHGTAVFLRSGNELVGQALVLRLGDVARGDGRDTDTGDVLFPDVHAEGKVGGEDDLAVHLEFWVLQGTV